MPWLSYRFNDGGAMKMEFRARKARYRRNMALDLPPLNGLRLFEAAARCGSFKRAAQELNLTPGAISHGINSLEEWLGVELFDRSHKLVLTSAGNRYLPYVKEALSMIAKATSETVAGDRDAYDTAGAAVGLKIGLR
jgi:LysR family transcriptional regulator, glycine cleavage system transcriptional activator